MRHGPRGRLIAVSGVDCAGKSTQLELLEKELRQRGLPVKRFWYRPGYSRGMDGIRSLARKVFPRMLPKASDREARSAAFSRRGVAEAWARLALLDMALQYGLKARVLRGLGYTVLLDRYVEDGLMDLQLRFPHLSVNGWRLTRCVVRLCPKPDRAVLLLVPRETMLARMETKGEPFPDPPHVREARYRAYGRLASDGRHEVINATRTVEQVHEMLISKLEIR